MSKQAIFRDTTIKILSVVFAIFLWFYVITEQNPVVTKDISIPVRIDNIESLNEHNLVMLDNANSFFVTLKLKGKSEILHAINQNSFTAYADLSGYKLEGENSVPVAIKGIPDGVAIVTRFEPSIRVNLDKKLAAQRPVSVNVTGNPIGGLASMTPLLTPSEVVLTGAESQIEKVKTIKVDIDIAGANADVTKKLPVRLLDAEGKDVTGIQLGTQWVNVTVPIANTKRVPIQLVLEGSPEEGYTIASQLVQPKEILVTGDQLALESLSFINASKIVIDNLTEDITLPLTLDLPAGIQLVNTNEQINVTLDIQKVITSTVDVSNIEFRNLSPGYRIDNTPNLNIKLTLRGPEDLVNQAQQNIVLYLDMQNAREGSAAYEVLWDKVSQLDILDVSPRYISLDIKGNE